MAIYTNYGRFLKAKQFKDSLEASGDTYMIFGIGNPAWDNNRLSMPIASYNTHSILEGDSSENQFYDSRVCQYAITSNSYHQLLYNGSTVGCTGHTADFKDMLPPFPCLWSSTDDEILITIGDEDIKRNNYHLYYIKSNGILFDLYRVDAEDPAQPIVEDFEYETLTSDIQREYFAELYIRGLHINDWWVAPGILGAVKCKIEFVKDIGSDDTAYTGSIEQMFYGDRYWESVPDSDLASYYNYFTARQPSLTTYPTHLFISALVNPGYLISNLNLDQNLCARQIAICSTKKPSNPSESNPTCYRASEYLFNFGQYYKNNSDDKWYPRYGSDHTTALADSSMLLDFTIPLSGINSDANNVYPLEDASKKFNFILHDYILGNRRDKHSADRVGYVIGF